MQVNHLEFKKRMSKSTIQSDPPNGHLDTWHGAIRDLDVPSVNNEEKGGDIDQDLEEKEDIKLFNFDFSSLSYDTRNVHLSFDNLLLRGSELRNSDWIYAIVIYTGFDCKIFMNNKSRQRQLIKRSSIEHTLNKFIFYMAGAIFICLMCHSKW